jgi:hypothetical protein
MEFRGVRKVRQCYRATVALSLFVLRGPCCLPLSFPSLIAVCHNCPNLEFALNLFNVSLLFNSSVQLCSFEHILCLGTYLKLLR